MAESSLPPTHRCPNLGGAGLEVVGRAEEKAQAFEGLDGGVVAGAEHVLFDDAGDLDLFSLLSWRGGDGNIDIDADHRSAVSSQDDRDIT